MMLYLLSVHAFIFCYKYVSIHFFFFPHILHSYIIMTYSIIYQAARPAMVSVSKRSLAMAYSPIRAFSTEEPKYLEQVHHQVAPLTDSTLYAPQGYSTADAAASANSSTATETIFTPSVNAVFDD